MFHPRSGVVRVETLVGLCVPGGAAPRGARALHAPRAPHNLRCGPSCCLVAVCAGARGFLLHLEAHLHLSDGFRMGVACLSKEPIEQPANKPKIHLNCESSQESVEACIQV